MTFRFKCFIFDITLGVTYTSRLWTTSVVPQLSGCSLDIPRKTAAPRSSVPRAFFPAEPKSLPIQDFFLVSCRQKVVTHF